LSQALQRSPDGPAANPIGTPFIELQSVDSTNNYARQQIHAGLAQHGMAVFAHEQVAGKGQRGRTWTSEKGKNIALSVLISPKPLTLSQQFQLSACVAVAVHDFFMKYAIDKVKIKWPNDLYWQDRKAGGVLIESGVRSRESGVGSQQPGSQAVVQSGSSVVGSWDWAIVGIGINLNQTVFPDHLPNPVSLKQITGTEFDTIKLAKELCNIFQQYFTELITSGFDNIFRLYNRHLYKLDEKVKLKKENVEFEAFIKGVSPAGKLIAVHAIEKDPLEIEYDFEEVEWIV
jgi:BirA family biotin operon repressor/biotin-[acetyl-CoA-carboxylase] ligase